jgi:hypothetical protein
MIDIERKDPCPTLVGPDRDGSEGAGKRETQNDKEETEGPRAHGRTVRALGGISIISGLPAKISIVLGRTTGEAMRSLRTPSDQVTVR